MIIITESTFESHILTLIIPGGGGGDKIIILGQKITISRELNIRRNSDQSVNSSLCVVFQEKINSVLYLFQFSFGNRTSPRTAFSGSKIEIFDNFSQNSRSLKV